MVWCAVRLVILFHNSDGCYPGHESWKHKMSSILRKLHGCFSLQLKLTRSHPKDVFFGSFLSSGTKCATRPLGLSPEGGICVTYRSNPPTVTRDPRLGPGPF